MGAETETDGQGDAMKQKWHKLYGNYITYLILVGLGLYYISVIALDIWVFHAPDLSFSIPCFLMLTCPAILSIGLSYKPQVFSRLLTRCSFDAEGIHCRSPRWGRFTLRYLLTVRGGSVYFTTETGEELDITGQFSEAEPYVYSYTASDGSAHDIVIGGSLEDYGYMEYVYDAGGSFVGSAGILPTGYDSANSPPWLTAYEEARGLSF